MRAISFFVSLLLLSTVQAHAQQFPSRAIRMIVPYAAGGPYDAIVRVVSEKAGTALGQPIIIDNRGGAGGVLGADLAAKSPGDGYTLVTISPGQTGIAAATNAAMPYDPQKDLVPVIAMVEDRLILIGGKTIPAKNVGELIAYLKTRPGQVNYSSAGNGSMSHLVMELFKQTYGVDVVHIPYRGTAPALMALIKDEVGLQFASPSGVKAFIDEGKVVPFIAASAARSAILPDVPTMSELGFANLDSPLWYVVAAPRGTPPEVIIKLFEAYATALRSPEVRERMAKLGVEIVAAPPETAAKIIDADIERWGRIVRAANIKLE